MEEIITHSLGMDAITTVTRIVSAHPEIAHVFFGQPNINPPFQKRLKLSEPDLRIFHLAEQQWWKRENGFPFLDNLMLALLRSESTSEALLEGAVFHQGISESQFSLTSDSLTEQKVVELAHNVPSGKMLTMCSEVRLKDGSTRHIPMMDFQCPANEHSLLLVREVAQLFRVGPGFIVATRNSYHFYGIQLVSTSEMANFLGRALLFSPIVDQVWIGHQLIDLCCALRIADYRDAKRPSKVVAVVH